MNVESPQGLHRKISFCLSMLRCFKWMLSLALLSSIFVRFSWFVVNRTSIQFLTWILIIWCLVLITLWSLDILSNGKCLMLSCSNGIVNVWRIITCAQTDNNEMVMLINNNNDNKWWQIKLENYILRKIEFTQSPPP